tara:strand:+ start:485 stop:610 length:126 start_codon:yes stop_codon:yes gene_type:complete
LARRYAKRAWVAVKTFKVVGGWDALVFGNPETMHRAKLAVL